MAWTEKGREHEARMKKMEIDAEQQKRAEQLAAQERADKLHYENEEKRRHADERRESQNRASQERIARTNAEKEIQKARIEEESLQAERDLKISLAQKQVEASAKEQEERTERKRIEETEETTRTRISATRDVIIEKSRNESNVKMREQERLETQFIEREITRRGALTLEFMKEELNKLDRERERKHLEFEKLIDTTRQRQKELQDAFERTGDLELIAQISECETTLKQYISQDKKAEKQYGADKFLINEKMNRLFIDADSGEN